MPIVRTQQRRDTTENWKTANPILLDGEIGLERTKEGTTLIKFGDGIRKADGTLEGTKWLDLPYTSGPKGDAGRVPEHKWEGTKLSFENPDGSWGNPCDLTPESIANLERLVEECKESFDNLATGSNINGVRNTVLHGREKDGYPAYLLNHSFIDMQHQQGNQVSKKGKVSASTNYNTTYHHCTQALKNQVVWEGNGWLTANTVTTGFWQYDFFDGPHIITGLYFNMYDSNPTAFPKEWNFSGLNEESDEWEIIYERKIEQKLRGWNNNNKSHGRMFWFCNNTKSYKSFRINILSNNGQSYTGLSVIKFYETVVPGLKKGDVCLYASDEEPLIASVSLNEFQDYKYTLRTSHIIKGENLLEMSRNYLYLVPMDETTNIDGTIEYSVPDYVNNMQNHEIIERASKKFVLGYDTRRIHYGSMMELEHECFVLLQSSHTTDYLPVPTGLFESNKGAYNYPLSFEGKMEVRTDERFRGSKSSYWFTGNTSSWIKMNTSGTTSFPEKIMCTLNGEFTLEIDFKWGGPSEDKSDNYYIIFDAGWYTNAGWAVGYRNRTKCIIMYYHGGCMYSVPFNANDDKYHTLSISRRSDKHMYIHIDGKCLGKFEETIDTTQNYRYWGLGRWIHTGDNYWYGGINNVRYTLGTCLYQGEDYVVSPNFNTSLIPDKTLWWNPKKQVVQEYSASTNTWKDTPMCPIGHVDTGWREHLLTDQPLGTCLSQSTKYLESFSQSKYYDTYYTADSLFNYGYCGEYPYCTPASATTTDHWVEFTLDTEFTFDQLIFTNTTWDWRAYPCLFTFEGFDTNSNTWEVLIDHTTFVDDGGLFQGTKSNGNSYPIQGMKRYLIEKEKQKNYKKYRITLPKKGEIKEGTTVVRPKIQWYGDYAYTAMRIMLPFADSTPEITKVCSYCCRDRWEYGPIPVSAGTALYIPIPFENTPYKVEGFIDDEADQTVKRRVLGQQSVHTSGEGYYGHGEVIYQGRDFVGIQFGNHTVTVFNGYYGMRDISGSSTNANLYIVCKKDI